MHPVRCQARSSAAITYRWRGRVISHHKSQLPRWALRSPPYTHDPCCPLRVSQKCSEVGVISASIFRCENKNLKKESRYCPSYEWRLRSEGTLDVGRVSTPPWMAPAAVLEGGSERARGSSQTACYKPARLCREPPSVSLQPARIGVVERTQGCRGPAVSSAGATGTPLLGASLPSENEGLGWDEL